MSNTSKIVLITGATAGIGRMTALYLTQHGHHVIATGRKVGELAKLAAEAAPGTSGGRLDTVALDVTSSASIAAAASAVDSLTSGHGVDVLINNAGFGVLGPTMEITDAELRSQFETNVFGLMNVTRAFLPKMMERRAGRVINVSSVGGRLTLPFFGAYNSTKYALESLSDGLRWELRAFGIDVVLVEPGVIRTNFEATAAGQIDRFSSTPYGKAMANYEKMSKSADRFASNPIVIAKALRHAVETRRPAARYVAPWHNAALIFMSKIVPQRMWDWALRKLTHLTPSGLGLDRAPAPTSKTSAGAPFAPLGGQSAPTRAAPRAN